MTIHGGVNLVLKTAEEIEILDYKTDLTRRAETKYRKQLSVYSHVLDTAYPEKPVTAKLLHPASTNESRSLALDKLRDTVRAPIEAVQEKKRV